LCHGGFELAWRRAKFPSVDVDNAPAAITSATCYLTQQGALADATGTANVNHAGRRVMSIQTLLDKDQLGRTACETDAVAIFKTGCESPARLFVNHLAIPARIEPAREA